MAIEPHLKQKRRAKGIELVTFTVSLPKALVDTLEESEISSQRGAGNLSVFLEIASYITIGLFKNPEMAFKNLVRLIRQDSFAPKKLSRLAENMEEIVNLMD